MSRRRRRRSGRVETDEEREQKGEDDVHIVVKHTVILMV